MLLGPMAHPNSRQGSEPSWADGAVQTDSRPAFVASSGLMREAEKSQSIRPEFSKFSARRRQRVSHAEGTPEASAVPGASQLLCTYSADARIGPQPLQAAETATGAGSTALSVNSTAALTQFSARTKSSSGCESQDGCTTHEVANLARIIR